MVRGSIDTDSQLLGDARQLLRDQKSKRRKATRRGRGNLGRFRVRAKAVNTDPSKDIATKEADRSRPRNMSASTTSQQNNLHLWEQVSDHPTHGALAHIMLSFRPEYPF